MKIEKKRNITETQQANLFLLSFLISQSYPHKAQVKKISSK